MTQEMHTSLINADTVFHLILFHGNRNLGARKMACKVILLVGSVNITDTCIYLHNLQIDTL
jgi:hypothetical protein